MTLKNVSPELLRELYWDDELSILKIAKQLDVSKERVLRKMCRYGIPRRSLSEARRLRQSCCKYPEATISQLPRSLLIGTLLGDGYCGVSKGGRTPYVQVGHKFADYDYLKFKYDILKKTGLITAPIRQDIDNGFYSYFITVCHPVLWEFRNLFYPDGYKTVSLEILEQVTPFALAIWYMDDGNTHYSKRSQKVTLLNLHTQSFGSKGNYLIQRWLKEKYGVNVRVSPDNGFHIQITGALEMQKLLDIIRPYIIPCMIRKLVGAQNADG